MLTHYDISRYSLLMIAVLTSTSCSGGQRSDWDDIDYTSVYRRAAQRDNDARYKSTGDAGCLDDDMYSCR